MISNDALAMLVRALESDRISMSGGLIRVHVNRGEEKIATAIEVLARYNVRVKSVYERAFSGRCILLLHWSKIEGI